MLIGAALRPLIGLLKDPDGLVRVDAASALAELADHGDSWL